MRRNCCSICQATAAMVNFWSNLQGRVSLPVLAGCNRRSFPTIYRFVGGEVADAHFGAKMNKTSETSKDTADKLLNAIKHKTDKQYFAK